MAHNILKTLRNLLRWPTSDTDVTPTRRTGATGLDIRPAATQEEVQAIRTLLTEQVPYPNFVPSLERSLPPQTSLSTVRPAAASSLSARR